MHILVLIVNLYRADQLQVARIKVYICWISCAHFIDASDVALIDHEQLCFAAPHYPREDILDCFHASGSVPQFHADLVIRNPHVSVLRLRLPNHVFHRADIKVELVSEVRRE